MKVRAVQKKAAATDEQRAADGDTFRMLKQPAKLVSFITDIFAFMTIISFDIIVVKHSKMF